MTDGTQPRPGNPNIAEYGKNTQIGAPGGLDPNVARKRVQFQGVRAELRKLMCEDMDFEVDGEGKLKLGPIKGKMTRARYIALKQFEKAMQGHDFSVGFVTENTEGKLANVNLNADLDTEGTRNDPLYIEAKASLLRGAIQAPTDGGEATPPGPDGGGVRQEPQA